MISGDARGSSLRVQLCVIVGSAPARQRGTVWKSRIDSSELAISETRKFEVSDFAGIGLFFLELSRWKLIEGPAGI